jgi:ribosomal protein S3
LLRIAEVLTELLPEDAQIYGIRVQDSNDVTTVTILTRPPGDILGPRQDTARAISAALEVALGTHVALNIEETL